MFRGGALVLYLNQSADLTADEYSWATNQGFILQAGGSPSPGGGGGGGGGPSGPSGPIALDDLTDVDTAGAFEGYVLTKKTSGWGPAPATSGGGTNTGGGGTTGGISANDARLQADADPTQASVRTLGAGARQAAAGSDTRFSDSRTPVDKSVTSAKIADALKPSIAASAGTEALRALGTAAGTAAAGNDTRLSDQRVPTDNSVTSPKIAGSLKPSGTAATTDEALRSLGTGAGQAAAGSDLSAHTVATTAHGVDLTKVVTSLSVPKIEFVASLAALTSMEQAGQGVAGALYAYPITTAPTVTYVVEDDFERDVSSGLGSAPNPASAYTTQGGAIANFNVVKTGAANGDGYASVSNTTANGSRSFLIPLTKADQNHELIFSLDTVPGADQVWHGPVARAQSATSISDCYRARVAILSTGVVQCRPEKVTTAGGATAVGGTALTTVAGLTYTAGMKLRCRLNVSGTTTTTVAVTVWQDGATEPSTVTVTGNDTTTPFTTSVAAGVFHFNGGSVPAGSLPINWRDYRWSVI